MLFSPNHEPPCVSFEYEPNSPHRGFAALIPDTLDTQMSAWSSDGALIEEDSVVTIQNGDHEMTIDV